MRSKREEALGRFLNRVWRADVAPLLKGSRAAQRRRTARAVGKFATGAGLLIDSLARLRGRPFTRSMAVLGSTFGAMLPDVWDWRWLRRATDAQRRKVQQTLERRAGEMRRSEALAILGLPRDAGQDEIKAAWRAAAARWHPDKARDEARRAEHQLRFITLRAAYDSLTGAG